MAYEQIAEVFGSGACGVAHGKKIGVGVPAVGIDPGVEVHQAAVGELVDVDVGHFAFIGHTKTDPVLAFAALDLRKVFLVGSVLEDDGCHGLYAVGGLRKMERPVFFLAFEIFCRAFEHLPVEVFGIIMD